MRYLHKVTLEGMHFKQTGKGGMSPKPIPTPIESNAFGARWSPETNELIYYTPNTEEVDGMVVEAEPTEHILVITDEDIQSAIDELNAPPALDAIRALKLDELSRAAKVESASDLTTSEGLVFHTDASTMIHVQGLLGWFESTGSPVYPNYKNADGSVNNLTKANVETAIAEYTARLYDIYSVRFAGKKALIEAATEPEIINSIAWE